MSWCSGFLSEPEYNSFTRMKSCPFESPNSRLVFLVFHSAVFSVENVKELSSRVIPQQNQNMLADSMSVDSKQIHNTLAGCRPADSSNDGGGVSLRLSKFLMREIPTPLRRE
jgi:hypothetical protein